MKLGVKGGGFSCMSHYCHKGSEHCPKCILMEVRFGEFLRMVRRVWVVRNPIPSTGRGYGHCRSMIWNGCGSWRLIWVWDLDLGI